MTDPDDIAHEIDFSLGVRGKYTDLARGTMDGVALYPNYIRHPLTPNDMRDSVMRFNDCAGKWEFWSQWDGHWHRGGGSAYLKYWCVVAYDDTWAEPFISPEEEDDPHGP